MISPRKWTQLFVLIVVGCQLLCCQAGNTNFFSTTERPSDNQAMNMTAKPLSHDRTKSPFMMSKSVMESKAIVNQSAMGRESDAGLLLEPTVLSKEASVPCPNECYCDRLPNPYSRGEAQKTTDCSNLNLKEVPQGIWTETEVLLLDRNHLGPEQLVRLPQMCNLITMDLSHNNLYQLQPFMGACLGNLRNLIIGGNSLEYLPQDVFVSFPNLDQLKLTMNGIEVMDKSAFSGLHKLTHLDLSENRLFSPNPDWFQDLESLEVLDLSHNNLHMLPREGFRFLTSLRILDLSFNQIQHVYPHAFHGLTGLKQLFLNSNHIPSVPFQSTRIFSSIELMDISNNHFKYLQAGDFHGLNVSHLKLNNNKNLLIIDKDTFVNLQLLEKLEVQNNEKLVYLDRRAFTGLKRLDTILLSGNGFTGLDPGSIPSLPTVKALSLGGNPWTCDCRLEWIDSVLSASQSDVTLVDKRTTSCAAPDTKMGCLIPAAANQEKCDKANGTASSQDIAENDNDPDTSLHPSSTQRPPLSQDVQSSKHSVTSQPSESSACKPAVVALFAKAIEPYIGEEIQLDCRARGQPEPEIEWIISTNKGTDTFHILKPGQSLSRDTRVSVLETGSLHIEYVNHYDIGNYTCKAVNVHGESAFTGSLTIKSVLSHIIVVRVTDTSVTVTWKTDIHVHGYQILYRVKAPNSTIYHKVDILPYMKYYTVSGLSPRTGYEICIAVKHGEKSLLISCNITGTKSIGYTKTAVHDATGYIVGGTTVCLCAFVVLMCIGSHAVRMYNRKRKYPLEGQTGEDSDMFLAGLDSLSETSPMTYENRFALMFDDSDIEEIQISAAEASASLGLRIDTDV